MTAVQHEAFARPADAERLDRAASGLRERSELIQSPQPRHRTLL